MMSDLFETFAGYVWKTSLFLGVLATLFMLAVYAGFTASMTIEGRGKWRGAKAAGLVMVGVLSFGATLAWACAWMNWLARG